MIKLQMPRKEEKWKNYKGKWNEKPIFTGNLSLKMLNTITNNPQDYIKRYGKPKVVVQSFM